MWVKDGVLDEICKARVNKECVCLTSGRAGTGDECTSSGRDLAPPVAHLSYFLRNRANLSVVGTEVAVAKKGLFGPLTVQFKCQLFTAVV